MKPVSEKSLILVVDDEDETRQLIVQTLEFAGYKIIQAQNGEEGLERLDASNPKMILCDISMPIMDGYSFLKKLKEKHYFDNIPFVFLTSRGEKHEIRHGMYLGADDYLIKPLTVQELVDCVATQLKKRDSLQDYYDVQFKEVRNMIFYTLPHEFRTPLSSILGYAQVMMQVNNIPSDDIPKFGNRIYRSGQRLLHMLENVLLMNQLYYWKLNTICVENLISDGLTSLIDIITTISTSLMKQYQRPNDIRLIIQDYILRISSIHLKKILEEILDNALKFSNTSSMVVVTTHDLGNTILIQVSDVGRGMLPEQIECVNSFNQFDRETFEQQGLGLGLVIARELTELYQGSLVIKSQIGQGTTVSITLPKLIEQS